MHHPKLLTLTAAIALLTAPTMIPSVSWLPGLSGQAFAASNNIDKDSDNDGILNALDLGYSA